MTGRHAAPVPIAVLGYAGTIPFLGGALAAALPGIAVAVFGFTLYAAAILAFLGGLQWGLIIDDPHPTRAVERLAVGALAALVGPAAFAVAPVIGVSTLLIAHIALLFWEHWRTRQYMPPWYPPLRVRLTAVAVVCHIVVLVSVW